MTKEEILNQILRSSTTSFVSARDEVEMTEFLKALNMSAVEYLRKMIDPS